MSLEVRKISKSFGRFAALRDVSLKADEGQLVALLGPSGCGKTTLLRIIAGLESPDPATGGAVLFNGEDVTGISAGLRRVGFVFQHYALFRNMTVFENIAFGLRVRPRRVRPTKAEVCDRVQRLLELIQLQGLADRYPAQLSGGQRQRVALARALAIEPRVLLLDEPFGALDAKVRQGLRRWLRKLHEQVHVMSILVTHDQEEALEVADKIVVINQGRVEQEGTPDDVFHHPASEFVIDFFGNVNLFHGRIESGKAVFGPFVLEQPETAGAEGRTARLFVRPHEIELHRDGDGHGALRAKVTRIQSAGARVRVEVLCETGDSVLVETLHQKLNEQEIHLGDDVLVSLRDARLFLGDHTN